MAIPIGLVPEDHRCPICDAASIEISKGFACCPVHGWINPDLRIQMNASKN
jgi:hypothetical protein